ncbi:hypothetical protein DF186_23225, partial [Enterococcus hirae]
VGAVRVGPRVLGDQAVAQRDLLEGAHQHLAVTGVGDHDGTVVGPDAPRRVPAPRARAGGQGRAAADRRRRAGHDDRPGVD